MVRKGRGGNRGTNGVMGIEDRCLEPRAKAADDAFLDEEEDTGAAAGARGVSRSFRNCALFMVVVVCLNFNLKQPES